jgi:ABC-type sugar transport system substrate-binding protein
MRDHRQTVRGSVLSGLLVAAMALLLAACGSGDDSSTATGSSSAAASPATSTAAAASPAVAEATAAVQEYSKAPTDIGVTEPLNGSVRGKKVVFEQCLAPICALIANQVKGAAAKLGVDVQIISTGATPDTITKAFNAAVAANPDAVIASSIPTVLWANQLAQLAAKGTPVLTNATLAKPSKGVVAQFYDDAVTANVGLQDANWVISDSNASAKTAYVFTPEFAGLFPQVNTYRDKLKADCPDCSFERLDVKSTDVGKVIPGRVVSYLQQHPEVKYVVFQYGDLATGVPQALKTAGLEGIKLVSSGGGPVNYQYIQQGLQARDMALYLDVYGWQIMDATAKAMLKQDVVVPKIPESWIDQSNDDFDAKQQPPFGNPDWQQDFLKLWAKST